MSDRWVSCREPDPEVLGPGAPDQGTYTEAPESQEAEASVTAAEGAAA